jgi:energy-coupling factor transport system permease protein
MAGPGGGAAPVPATGPEPVPTPDRGPVVPLGVAGPQPGGLRSLDPLSLVGTAALLSAAGLLSGSVGLNLVLAATAMLAAVLGGLPVRRVALLAVPAVLAAASVGFSNALLGDAGVTSPEAWAAAALPASRVLAVALPGLVAAVALDPTALADALVVRLRVPARAAYSALAGLRLLPLLADEWTVLGRASRARGLGGSGFAARVRRFASMTFRLLVAALRRGGRLAVALDARGLRSDAPRTVARPLRGGTRDAVVLGLGVIALAASIALRVL